MLKCCMRNVEMPWPKCWFIWNELLYDFAIRIVRYNHTIIKVVEPVAKYTLKLFKNVESVLHECWISSLWMLK